MLYDIFQLQSNWLNLQRDAAIQCARWLGSVPGIESNSAYRATAAGFEMLSAFKVSHRQPSFNIGHVSVDGQLVPVVEAVVMSTEFATLLHFRKTAVDSFRAMPKVLVVAPLSGHFSTLLRDTVRVLLRDHDVFITNWHNARDVPRSASTFGFSDYIDHLIQFMERLSPDLHILAVCQPCVQVLAAVAVMAADNNSSQPKSMTLMAGPVDIRSNPTAVNELALSKPLQWFEQNLISRVPWMHRGAGRRVYPGFVQLSAFMSMNVDKHKKAYENFYQHLLKGETDKAAVIQKFYEEYFAVLDLTAEFYLETVDIVFQRALLAKGELTHHGRPVDPGKIRRTALLTVEAERDDICGFGQTAAAHGLCTALPPFMKRHHLQPGAGHYGVFSGRRWETQVYPLVSNMILAAS